MWLGLLIGLLAGVLLFRDFGTAVALAIVGAIVGAVMKSNKAKNGDADNSGTFNSTSTPKPGSELQELQNIFLKLNIKKIYS